MIIVHSPSHRIILHVMIQSLALISSPPHLSLSLGAVGLHDRPRQLEELFSDVLSIVRQLRLDLLLGQASLQSTSASSSFSNSQEGRTYSSRKLIGIYSRHSSVDDLLSQHPLGFCCQPRLW